MQTRVASALLGADASEQTPDALVSALRDRLDGAEPALVLLFASPKHPLGEYTAAASRAFSGATVLGASSAGEFTQDREAKGTVAAVAIAGDFRCFAGLGEGLRAGPEAALDRAIAGLPLELAGFAHRTALLLLDPLAGNAEEVTLLAAERLGDGVRLAGGAAGDDLRMQRTEVALGPHAATDAVVVAALFSREPVGVGICHAHEPLSPPLRVTRADGGVVREVEGRPAWDVWVEQTRERAVAAGVGDPATLDDAARGAFLLRYEAGLAVGEQGEYKIRAPLSRNEDGSLNFACGVPEGAVFRITESVPERQVGAAREAARRAAASLAGPAAGAVVFDCICRNLILGDSFARAVKGMSDELGGVPLAGFETYGEIALDVGDLSGFHNTTSVVLAFPRG